MLRVLPGEVRVANQSRTTNRCMQSMSPEIIDTPEDNFSPHAHVATPASNVCACLDMNCQYVQITISSARKLARIRIKLQKEIETSQVRSSQLA